MSFENIPAELREKPIWVNFDIEGGKKIPYVAGNCSKASSNKPSDWRTFDEAISDVEEGRRQHIGCAIQWPYIFVDLDEPHPEIFEAFDTFAETSVSGNGTHLIGRGSFEGPGRHPKSPAVGLFKENRFILVTGNLVDGRSEIKDLNEDQLQSLHDWLSGTSVQGNTTTLVEVSPILSDNIVLSKARERFDTFDSLYNGNAGPDHSESDHALIAMLADCTDSNEQVRQLWFSSPLCRPHRRNDKYVDRSLKKIRGKQEMIDSIFEAPAPIEEEKPKLAEGSRDLIDSMPEGNLKKMAMWHWEQSYYPLQEASISSVFAAAGTIAGRNFQTATGSGKGLNPWIILVGPTACGKNEYQNGITKIFRSVSEHNKLGTGFLKMLTGPLASGEGAEDALAKRPRLNSYFPEWHEYYHNLVAPNAAPHHRTLKEKFLDLFEQSSQGALLKRRIKARGRDEEEPEAIEAPCLVVSGETTPRAFYEKMNSNEIENGFLPRLFILNVDKRSISRRPNPEAGKAIDEDLLDALLEIFVRADLLAAANEYVRVEMEPAARELYDSYANFSRDRALDEGKDIYNRAGLKAIRFASLFAVFDNPFHPVVTEEQMLWSINLVNDADQALVGRFESGGVGTGQGQQEKELMDMLQTARKMSSAKKIKAGIPAAMSKQRDVVPYSWLKKKAIMSSVFASDRNGAVAAFERCLNHMTAAGDLCRMSVSDMEERFGKGCGPGIGVTGS